MEHEEHREDHPYPDNHEGLTSAEAEARLLKFGRNELVEKKTPSWLIFLKCLWGPMPIAIWIAVIIEFALKNWPDGGILLCIQFGNATIGWYETTKAGDAVAALKNSLKPRATVFRDGQWQEINAALVVPGDKVKLGSGSAVPADCSINDEEGNLVKPQIDVDEAALTGESLPVTMLPKSHTAKMGSTVVRGEVDGTVQFTGGNTVFGKTALLLAAVSADLGNIHYVLVKVMYGLTGLSMILCLIVFFYIYFHHFPNLDGTASNGHVGFKDTLEFTVVLLIVSIPIAIEIVVTTTLALGSKELSARKVIVTRLSAIEMMAAVNMLCSDKTGTLTQNKMQIQDYCPVFTDKDDRESTLVYAALAAKWREPPRDALDTMVLGAANLDACDAYKQVDFKPFDPRVKRTEATLVGPDGVMFKVTKGAPNIVLSLCHNAEAIKPRVDGIITDLGGRGIRCLAIARTYDEEWHMIGILTFLDPPRVDTKATIEQCHEYGVDVKMVTGDHQLIAKEMARMLNMGTNILTAEGLPQFPASGNPDDIPDTLGETHGDMIAKTDGFAQVHPEHKYLIVETLRQRGFTCAMTGDGVNDAPALKRADVGIAVEGSTDAARAASDMVLTDPGLKVIGDSFLIARGVFQRMLSFLTYRVSATLQLVFFFFISVFLLPPPNYLPDVAADPLSQFFHLPVLQFMLITLLNDGTLMAIGYDRVFPQPRPQVWNLTALFFIAAVLAGVALISSLLLLWLVLDSNNNPNSVFAQVGLPKQDYPHIITAVYLKISISDFLTLFSARTQNKPFFAYRPSGVLFFGACFSLSLSTIVASTWPESRPDKILTRGLCLLTPNQTAEGVNMSQKLMPLYVWLFCIVFWFIQDLVKVAIYWCMDRFDWFSYRTLNDPDRKIVPASPAGGSKKKPVDEKQRPLLHGDDESLQRRD